MYFLSTKIDFLPNLHHAKHSKVGKVLRDVGELKSCFR